MYAKLLAIIAGLFVVAMAMLVLRQQRLDAAHDLAALHSEYRAVQRDLWRQRARAAEMTMPGALDEQLSAQRIAVEPAVPSLGDAPRSQLVSTPMPTDQP